MKGLKRNTCTFRPAEAYLLHMPLILNFLFDSGCHREEKSRLGLSHQLREENWWLWCVQWMLLEMPHPRCSSSPVRFKDCFMIGAPPGAKGATTQSGWMNKDTWQSSLTTWYCTPDCPILLLLDNLKGHVSLKAVEKAKNNTIVLLTIPSHAASRSRRIWPVQDPLQPSYGWLDEI